MLSDILKIVASLPSQHVIFGIISTVLCIAVAWVYSNSSFNVKENNFRNYRLFSGFQ